MGVSHRKTEHAEQRGELNARVNWMLGWNKWKGELNERLNQMQMQIGYKGALNVNVN